MCAACSSLPFRRFEGHSDPFLQSFGDPAMVQSRSFNNNVWFEKDVEKQIDLQL